jgi:serine/threonine-protein kinase
VNDHLFELLRSGLSGEYTLERELGGGGMSRVYLAHDRRLGRPVVIKVLRPELAADVSADRFDREIRLAAQLQDPRIVPLLAAGHVEDVSFYTMPFVEGESLRSRLARGPISVPDAVGILRDIALALDYAHARHVVHRDIKPDNVLLTGRTAVVTDFGVAKALAVATEDGTRDTMTVAGATIGTPAYMAPEQASGDAVDERADIYAWGIVAYEMLAGAHPFPAHGNAQAAMVKHITEQPPSLSQRARHVPAPLVRLVDRALRKQPSERPQTTAEIVRTLDDLTASTRVSGWSGGRRSLATAVVALAGVALVAGYFVRPRARVPAGVIASSSLRGVAVLPFTSPDRDSSNAYFGAGMAEELTTALARVRGLRVASRGSASRFQDAGVPDAEIARRLRVNTLLEGTVRRDGDMIRVTARLVNPQDGTVLWADQYDRRRAQIFEMQDAIAQAIVAALLPTLGDTARVAAARSARGTEDLIAYDLYLKGRDYFGRRGVAGLQQAMSFFDQALRRDSMFARAWAGLSMAQAVLPMFASLPEDSVLTLARRNADRALQLDSSLSDAHLALAEALKDRWQWPAAEREFARALELSPDDAATHHWYGVLLYVTGQTDSGVAQLRQAQALDPLSIAIDTDLFYALYLARHYEDALAEGRRVLSMDPTKPDANLQIGMIQLLRGAPDSALASFETARRVGIGFDMRAFVSVANRRLGRSRVADSLYAALIADYRTNRSLAYAVAIAAAAAGDVERGIGAVSETVDRRSVFVTEISLPCDPLFDPLKRDPTFAAKLAAVGLTMCPP